MNEVDIKKCIKNGYAWTDVSKGPVRVPMNILRAMTGGWKGDTRLHATKRDAQLAIATRRTQARVDARKADGTQVPADPEPPFCEIAIATNPPQFPESPAHVAWRKRQEAKSETPEQRNARLKALYESYCKQGGLITKEQLTGEMWAYLSREKAEYYEASELGVASGEFVYLTFPEPANLDKFWTHADAEHDHFLRIWKGPLTEEAAKKLRPDDPVFSVSHPGASVWGIPMRGRSIENVKNEHWFLSAFEAQAAAHDLWIADRRENQMEAITNEQWKILREGDVIYIRSIFDAVAVKVNGDSDQISTDSGCYYFSAKAAQAALDKSKQPEHKFVDVPEWCPPLPDGYVPLGMGGTFRTRKGDTFRGRAYHKSDDYDRQDWDQHGSEGSFFYAAPRDSEIAILNYPWLKDESGDKPSPTEPVASHETPGGETQAKEVSTGETQAVTIRNHERGTQPTKTLSLANYGGAIPDHFTLDCKNFTFEQIQVLVKQNFIPSKPREWTDIPQPIAPRKPTLAEAFNVILDDLEFKTGGRLAGDERSQYAICLRNIAEKCGLKIRAVEGRAE